MLGPITPVRYTASCDCDDGFDTYWNEGGDDQPMIEQMIQDHVNERDCPIRIHVQGWMPTAAAMVQPYEDCGWDCANPRCIAARAARAARETNRTKETP